MNKFTSSIFRFFTPLAHSVRRGMLTNTSKNSPKLLGSKLSTAYWFKTEHVGPCTRTRFLTGRCRLVFHTEGAARSTINDLHPIQHVQHLHLQSLELWRCDPAELRLCHGKVSVVFDITYCKLHVHVYTHPIEMSSQL